MKRRVVLLGLALLLLSAPAFAQKIYIDYDKEYDFDKIKTYAWFHTKDTSVEAQSPLMHTRIVNAIEHYIAMGGTTEVQDDPDVYVTYHASSKEEMSLNTSSFGYGYPGGWGWGGYGMGYGYGGYGRGWRRWGGGMGSSTTTATTYTEGTLIVDAYEPSEKKMVWRGTGTVTLKEKPEKRAEQIIKIMDKMGNKWEKILARQGM